MGMTGLSDLNQRLDGVATTALAVSEAWARSAADAARASVPVRTGETRRTIRIVSADAERARVEAGAAAVLIEGGSKAHDITAHGQALAFQGNLARPIFAKRVHMPRIPARPFLAIAGENALENLPLADIALQGWDGTR